MIPQGPHADWTGEDVTMLRRLIWNCKLGCIALALGRTLSAVKNKCVRLGLKEPAYRRPNIEYEASRARRIPAYAAHIEAQMRKLEKDRESIPYVEIDPVDQEPWTVPMVREPRGMQANFSA